MRRILSTLIAGALVAGAFSIAPVQAQEAPEVPSEPNIVDPQGDANHHSTLTGMSSPGSLNGADILAIWFTSDAENVYTHIQTTNDARLESVTFVITVDPSKDSRCLQLRTTTGGNFNDPFASVDLTEECGEAGRTQLGEVTEAPGPDETSILTSTFPKKDVPLLADGTVLKAPSALVGHNGQQVSSRVLIIDDTEEGTDFTVTGDEPKEPKPPKKDKPKKKGKKKAKKNACKKLKGKAKKKCLKKNKKKKAKPKPCAAYEPGEQGAEADTSVVTDKATEEEPVEVTIPTEAGFGLGGDPLGVPTSAGMSHEFHNIQVDPKAKETGLWVRLEFSLGADYDIFLNDADGNEVANASGFNPLLPLNDGTGHGGHSENEAEALDGVKSADCQGYTLDIANATGAGEEVTLKLWLGEAEFDPNAEEEE